ncbi:hypothetical protein ACW2Q0_30940 [Nocardia sp. R16R-3T]
MTVRYLGMLLPDPLDAPPAVVEYLAEDDDAARLSAFIRNHIRLEGRYSFYLPDLRGRHRPLRDPDVSDGDEDD